MCCWVRSANHSRGGCPFTPCPNPVDYYITQLLACGTLASPQHEPESETGDRNLHGKREQTEMPASTMQVQESVV
jgi:hypothetical protein